MRATGAENFSELVRDMKSYYARKGASQFYQASIICLLRRGRKVRMTPGQHVPYTLGYTRDTMDGTTGRKTERRSKSL